MDENLRSVAEPVRCTALPRTVGLGLGLLCVGAVLFEHGAHPLAWTLLLLHCLVWPHIARLISLRSAHPDRIERRHLLVDSTLGGGWIALMGFSALPSVVVAAMLLMSNVGVGGWRLLLRGAGLMLLGGLAAVLVAGLRIAPQVSTFVLIASLPLLGVYPLLMGWVSHGIAQRLRRERHAFQQLSRTDALSGLHNRLHWDERVAVEFARLQRHGGEATLLLIDIDRFKGYNDTWGHGAGDEVIRQVARILCREARIEDGVARYGGEEFAVLLPGIGRDQALAAAERLRRAVESGCEDGIPGITVSVGAAPFTRALVEPEEWVQGADEALYVAKRGGRNRSELAAPPTGPAEGLASVGT